jgi:hypothetical protein
MKRALLIAGGTLGGLGAVMAITPPQFSSTESLALGGGAMGAKSATVVGPLGWLCDAMATALMVAGEDGAKYFAQPELEGYQVFVVDRYEESSWEI